VTVIVSEQEIDFLLAHNYETITRTPARRKKIGTVAGVRGPPSFT
jgi:hypothetical protein